MLINYRQSILIDVLCRLWMGDVGPLADRSLQKILDLRADCGYLVDKFADADSSSSGY